MKRMTVLPLGAIALAGLAFSASAAGNAAKGKEIFAAQCAACHSVEKGQNGIGPSLYGVYGRPAASNSNYQYSPALKSAHIVWTSAALSKFLANPQADVPGTKMPYMGMPSAGDRKDVIAYLASSGSNGK